MKHHVLVKFNDLICTSSKYNDNNTRSWDISGKFGQCTSTALVAANSSKVWHFATYLPSSI